MMKNGITYKPVCDNCGFILDEDVGIVTYHDLDKSGLVEMAHTEVYPRLCPNCNTPFVSIRLPKDVRRKHEHSPLLQAL